MKLLGWMHRKFRQNGGDPLKDFVIGQPLIDDQQYFPRTSINKPFKQAQKDLNSSRLDQDYEDDEPLASISEIFPGFLAIGTLGSSDPATPKFSISIDYITETETEVTENELKLISEELEKVLDAEAKDDTGSRRNSHGSTVNSNGKVLEGPENNGSTAICPLQGYLFGSSVEFSETTTVAKKENRTSLGELFQKSKPSEDEKDDQKQVEKKGDNKLYGIQLIKRKLKKKMHNPTASGDVLTVSTDQTKLSKIRNLFNRKVYPEITTMEKEKWDQKAQKNDKKKKAAIDGVHKNNGDRGSIMIFPEKLIFNQPSTHSDDDHHDWNKEQWIKTDADCK
ncbi:Protein LAZY 1, partial [Cucurbita argyrosperma subsp. sororia]